MPAKATYKLCDVCGAKTKTTRKSCPKCWSPYPPAGTPNAQEYAMVGAFYFMPLTDGVRRVEVLEHGDAGFNLKPSRRQQLRDPYLVQVVEGEEAGHEYIADRSELYFDAVAAAAKSAELYEEAMRGP